MSEGVLAADIWKRTLDRYEAALDHHARVLGDGGPVDGCPWPPPSLPTTPVPPHLEERAIALLARGDQLTGAIRKRMDELGPTPQRRRASPPTKAHARLSTSL